MDFNYYIFRSHSFLLRSFRTIFHVVGGWGSLDHAANTIRSLFGLFLLLKNGAFAAYRHDVYSMYSPGSDFLRSSAPRVHVCTLSP